MKKQLISEVQKLQKIAGIFKEAEDFDLSDNPFEPSFYKKHYAMLDNEDGDIIGFKDVRNEEDFNNRVQQSMEKDPIFKQAYEYYSENEPNFGAPYPSSEDEPEEPTYMLTFSEWAESVTRNWDYRENDEEDDGEDYEENSIINADGTVLLSSINFKEDSEGVGNWDKVFSIDYKIDPNIDEYVDEYFNGNYEYIYGVDEYYDDNPDLPDDEAPCESFNIVKFKDGRYLYNCDASDWRALAPKGVTIINDLKK